MPPSALVIPNPLVFSGNGFHNHRVRSIVPADKLLVCNVKRGWKPLCEFLGCDIPTIPFPHENVRAEIKYLTGRWKEVDQADR